LAQLNCCGGGGAVEISGNSGNGISGGSVGIYAPNGLVIASNGKAGIAAGNVNMGTSTGHIMIRDNAQGGVSVGTNGAFGVWGGVTIQNNGPWGINATVQAFISIGAVGGAEPVIIQGHTGQGINVIYSSTAVIWGQVMIRNNGSATGPGSAGIVTSDNSFSIIAGTTGESEISGNGGPGVLVDDKSLVDLLGTTISSNAEEGVRVLHMSMVDWSSDPYNPDPNAQANPGGALTCDDTSLLVADVFPAGQVRCHNVSAPGEKHHHHMMNESHTPVFPKGMDSSPDLYQRRKAQAQH
jgi:hypothetical protein